MAIIMSLQDTISSAEKDVVRVVLRCNDATENQKLDLSSCFLASFPDAVFMLMRNTQLESLDLSQNVLRKITPKLPQKFSYINSLNLSSNRLCALPDETSALENLSRLDLSKNEFMSIPWCIYRMPQLRFLDLSNNYIADVELDRLKQLNCEIRLNDNPLNEDCCKRLAKENLPSISYTPFRKNE
ncbi:leucine-rich repeat-containing protein 39-like [Varroa destructor]|uniref:Uncharacterized protein n=1 Tax=Varroa destructor TaxID=109461 RepID=A0A7M7JAR6_VARDE|nr:leucine-rich repeat-containing protein 39-like [Varroa destructor]XP_022643796.1 leucine-rich repeat-containing protein 39-like [Varroa destructor]